MTRRRSPRPHGQIRQSQLITTFGPGAMVDLPNYSVLVSGLDHWTQGGEEISEPRLAEKLAVLLEIPRIAPMFHLVVQSFVIQRTMMDVYYPTDTFGLSVITVYAYMLDYLGPPSSQCPSWRPSWRDRKDQLCSPHSSRPRVHARRAVLS